jgi:anaerobic dimethyl sulfoxide reductase subunit C
MNIREWTLPVYTILMQLATGSFLALWVLRSLGMQKYGLKAMDRISRYPVTVIAFTILAAMFGSHLHLSKPYFSILAMLNFQSSWLSREIVFNLLYMVTTCSLLYLLWQVAGKQRLKAALGWSAIVLGGFTVYSMARIYLIPTQAGWNTPFTVLSFFGSMFLLGTMSLALLLLLDIKFAELRQAGDLDLRKAIFRKSLVWISLAAVITMGAIIALNFAHISSLRGGDETAQTSLELLLGLYQPLFIMRIGAAAAGVLALFFTLYRMLRMGNSLNDLLTPLYSATLLVIIGEILGRFLFYATHVRIGI